MKTLKLIEQYKSLLEQDEIGGFEEIETETETIETLPPGDDLTPTGVVYVTELLLAAFKYIPDKEDLNIADAISQEKITTQPRIVIDEIKNLISYSDEGLEDILNKVTAR